MISIEIFLSMGRKIVILLRCFVKALQGPEVLNMRRVLWGSRWSVVQGLDEDVAAQARQRLRGKQVDCKLETKTRLKTATAGYL